MSNKTGWVTELDVIIGADTLSAEQRAYRQSRRVYINPKYEAVREANRKAGIIYKVRIGYTYIFDSSQDAFRFEYVRDRAYCSYKYFIDTLDDGRVWTSGDVEVWKEVTYE